MRNAQDPGGFSFELSESAPPVRSVDRTPLGELDLDLNDFGPELGQEATATQNAAANEENTSNDEAWPGSPFSPLVPEAVSASRLAPPAEEEAVLDFGTRSVVEPAAVQPAAVQPAAVQPAAVQPAAVQPAAVQPAAVQSAAVQPAAAQPTAQAKPPNGLTPAVKRLSFPAPSRPARAAGAPAVQAPAPTRPTAKGLPRVASAKPTTRFSASISQKAPEAALIERDSEPDALGEAAGSGQSIPEDLDLGSAPLPRSARAKDRGPEWGTETPTAREIWRTARGVWQTTSRRALSFSGQGLRGAQKLALNINHRLQLRLEAAARAEAAAQASGARNEGGQGAASFSQSPTTAADPAPATDRRSATDPTTAADRATRSPGTSSDTYHPSGTTQPSKTELRLIRLGQRILTKAAAPLSALAAAGLVYYAGTQLLGTDELVSLSKSSPAGPKVPDLGRLEARSSATTGPTSAGRTPGSESSPPPAPAAALMVTEQVKMPEGLSWPGKGLIEVVTSEDELIYIDGVFTGRGPLRRIPVAPGKHHVAIKTGGEERTGTVVVDADKNTRAVFQAPNAPSPEVP